MLKIAPIVRNTAVASAVALAALGTASCSKSEQKTNDADNVTTVLSTSKPMDFSKPNLPVIDKKHITYRNADGDIVEIDNNSDRRRALYQAVNKYSTKENPNIDDVEGFYCEVEKNNTPIYGSYRDVTARNTNLLKNLYDMFTAPDSEGGKTITVKEYTHMMDAWSSVK